MTETILLSLVTAWIAFTICESVLLAPLRQWVMRKNSWLGKLISCGYCTGFWVAVGLELIYRPRLFNGWWMLDYLLTVLVIAWLSAFQWILLCLLMDLLKK